MSQLRRTAVEIKSGPRRFLGWLQSLRDHSVAGVIGWIAVAIVAWVVANVGGWLGEYGDRSTAVMTGLGIVFGLVLGWWFEHRQNVLHQSATVAAIDDADRLLRLDETLFRHLLVLTEGNDLEPAIEGVVREVLQNIVAFFGDDVVRGTVLRPSDDALCAWVGYQMPTESMNRLRFSFTPTPGAPIGVALQAFKTRTIQFEKMKKLKDGRWKASSAHYVVHDSKRSRPPYEVFVAIPLALDNKVLGVLCLDSVNPDTFVKKRDEAKLAAIALRVSAPIAVYDSLAAEG